MEKTITLTPLTNVDSNKILDDISSMSNQEMRILMISLKQCLSDKFNIGDRDLWTAVHLKMKGEYNFDLKNGIYCQIRFEELFAKYLNVLNAAKSVTAARRQFKCFDLFNDINWQSVSDHRYRLVADLKIKYGRKTRIQDISPPVFDVLVDENGEGQPADAGQVEEHVAHEEEHFKSVKPYLEAAKDKPAHLQTLLVNIYLAEMIGKNAKCFHLGDFIKNCIQGSAKIISPLYHAHFSQLNLSRETIKRNIIKIASNIENQLRLACKNFKYYSICLDDTKDYTGTNQLAIFVRGVDENFDIREDFLDVVPLDNKKASTIFNNLLNILVSFNLDIVKLRGITTDGARALTGVRDGLVKKLKKHLIEKLGSSDSLKNFHCILHQEQLVAKTIKCENIINQVTNLLSLFRTKTNLYNDLKKYLKNEHARFTNLVFYTEIRWLSKGRSFERFYILLNYIINFLKSINYSGYDYLDSFEWQFHFIFIVDILIILNQVNSKLQGNHKIIFEMYDIIKNLKNNVKKWINNIDQGNVSDFKYLDNFLKNNSQEINLDDIKFTLVNLDNELGKKFKDFEKEEIYFNIYINPFKIENYPDIFKNELDQLKILYNEKDIGDILNFYRKLHSQFYNLKENAYLINCYFASTYVCEQSFSMLKLRKNSLSSTIADKNLSSCLRLILTRTFIPNVNEIINKNLTP